MTYYELLHALKMIVPAMRNAEVIMIVGGIEAGPGFSIDSVRDDTAAGAVYLVQNSPEPYIEGGTE